MEFSKKSFSTSPMILKRLLGGELLEPITIKATEFASTDVVKAGTPIKADGSKTTGTGAVGILLKDVYKSNPNGSLVKAYAVINSSVASEHSGVEYTETLKTALNLISFE